MGVFVPDVNLFLKYSCPMCSTEVSNKWEINYGFIICPQCKHVSEKKFFRVISPHGTLCVIGEQNL